MTEPARLHIVTEQSPGEIRESLTLDQATVRIQELTDLLAAKESNIRSLATQLANAKRDPEGKARSSRYWPKAVELFDLWRDVCGHKRSVWTADRFWAIEPFLREPKYGEHRCWQAIHGAAFDPGRKRLRNGRWQVYNQWGAPWGIFSTADAFEIFYNKAPEGIRAECLARIEAGKSEAGPESPASTRIPQSMISTQAELAP